jgi:hypothetical protein
MSYTSIAAYELEKKKKDNVTELKKHRDRIITLVADRDAAITSLATQQDLIDAGTVVYEGERDRANVAIAAEQTAITLLKNLVDADEDYTAEEKAMFSTVQSDSDVLVNP